MFIAIFFFNLTEIFLNNKAGVSAMSHLAQVSLDQIPVPPEYAAKTYSLMNDLRVSCLFCINHYEHSASGEVVSKTKTCRYPKFLVHVVTVNMYILYSLFWWRIYFNNFLGEYIESF